MSEGIKIINIYKDKEKFMVTKLNIYDYLIKIRNIISEKYGFSNFYFFNKNSSTTVEKNKEKTIVLSEILYNNNSLYIKTDLGSIEISVYLNQNLIHKINFSKNEKIKNFIQIIKNKIPNDSSLVVNEFKIDITEFENDDISSILDENNNIYFISQNSAPPIQTKNEEEKEQIPKSKNKEKIIIKMNDKTLMEKINISMNLSEFRNLLKKKNIFNFQFIYKFQNDDILLDKNDENNWKIEDILFKNEQNAKIIFLKTEDTENKNNNDESKKDDDILISFFNKTNNKKIFKKKLDGNLNLNEIRNIIKDEINKEFLFFKKNQKDEIEKDDEKYYKLNEIKDSNNNVYININESKLIKFKINGQNKFVIKTDINITLNELRNKFKEIPNEAKFLLNNYEVPDESTMNIIEILENNEIINLKIEEGPASDKNSLSEDLKSEKESTEIKYKIYLNDNFLKFLKQYNKATLDDIRNILSQQITNNELFFTSDGQKILLENENEWTLKDYCEKDNKIYLKTVKSKVEQEKKEEEQDTKNTPIEGAICVEKINDLEIYQYPKIKFTEEEKLNCKTIMVVGQTGSGKTTLLNSFLNYLMGIKYEDKFRYKIIIEKENQKDGRSVTSQVNIYYIRSVQKEIPNIRIIDTPGFGDTRGLDYDAKIIEMIKNTFTYECDTITAICFVAKSTETRFNDFQKYIFANVMSLFGNDVAENFIAMLTFCDGDEPRIKNYLEDKSTIFGKIIDEIQDPWYLTFNNSAIFSGVEVKFSKMFWDLGMDSYKVFIRKLLMLNEKSLKLSKDVLDLRKKLQTTILGLRPQLEQGLQLMENIRREINIIETNKDKIDQCKNFNYKFKKPEITKKQLPQGEHTSNCIICNYTCHHPCYIPDNNNKRNCAAMRNGFCTVCKNKCEWNQHKNLPYVFEYKEIEEVRSSEELRKKYYDSKNKLSASEQIINKLGEEFENILQNCYLKSDEIKKAVEELKRISLHVNPNEDYEEYIKFCIQNEQNEKKSGYLDRIKGYQTLLEVNSQMNKAFHEQNMFEDFEKFKKDVIENKKKELFKKAKEENSFCCIF